MSKDRWTQLMLDEDLELTAEEIKNGWHFCVEFDGLLIGPGMDEMKNCECSKHHEKH